MLGLAKLVNDISVEDNVTVRELPLNTLVRYYRVAVATPVVNPEGYMSLQAHFSKDHVAQLLVVWAHNRSVTSLRDAETLLAEGFGFHAFMATRCALEWAIDSHLASNGEANPSLKWRFEKLARRFGQTSELYQQAWGLKSIDAQELRELVPRLVAEGVTVFLTTHYMFEADQLCDTIAIINNGSLVALGTPREIKQGFSKVNVAEGIIRAPRKGLVEELRRLDGVTRTTTSSDGPFQRITLYTEVGVTLNGKVQDLVGQGNLERFVSREPTLEEAYIIILD
jgi:hypothetical protein